MSKNLRLISSDFQFYERDGVRIEFADSLTRYDFWQSPTVIISDGAYGLNLFPGDLNSHEGLQNWYAPHIAGWTKKALPETTLWFWATEIGWATVHPILDLYGWEYKTLHVWDKGVGHIAGNVNSKTIRGYPVVTEVCAQYVRKAEIKNDIGENIEMKQWLRDEWFRSGLPLSKTNEACGVKNAATRKYFTQCHLWYFPPPEMMVKLAAFAEKYGKPTEVPYFSLDRKTPLTAEQWQKMRAKWNHEHGVTNVWREPAVRGKERFKKNKLKSAHANQKPLKLISRLIKASSDVGDVIWEPFGGLCSTAIAALHTNRKSYSAEFNENYYLLAASRLKQEEPYFAELAAA
jgi:hypothetical protein